MEQLRLVYHHLLDESVNYLLMVVVHHVVSDDWNQVCSYTIVDAPVESSRAWQRT